MTAVRVLADAVVIEQAVAVAEVDALGDRVHRPVILTAQTANPQPPTPKTTGIVVLGS
jgi:hypothetical protein